MCCCERASWALVASHRRVRQDKPIFPGLASGARLGLGGAALGNLFTAVSDREAHAVIAAALADGCRTFDTAPHYGNGLSEHRFGEALRNLRRDDFCLSSKVGRLLRPDSEPRESHGYVRCLPYSQSWDYSAAGVRRSVEDSLQRLGLARLDAAYVHDCDAVTHGERYQLVLRQVLDEALPEMQRMKTEGLLRHVGLGVNDVQVCLDVLQHAELDVLLLAGRYSLIDHSALGELLPLCLRRNVRVALGGVFNSGILATGVRRGAPGRFNYGDASDAWQARVAAVEEVCEASRVPLRAAALRFPVAHPAVDIILIGPRSVAEWLDARAMLEQPIPDRFWELLRDRELLPSEAPLPPSS